MTRALLLGLFVSTGAFAGDLKPLLCTRDVREGTLVCQKATVQEATGVIYCPSDLRVVMAADDDGVGGSGATGRGVGGSRPTLKEDSGGGAISVSWSTGTTAPCVTLAPSI